MTTLLNAVRGMKSERPLWEKITLGLAKLEALEGVQVLRKMDRDSETFHKRDMAMWNGLHKQNPATAGIEEFQMSATEDGDMRDQIVLGDQIIVGDKAIKSMPSNEGEADDEEEESKPAPPESTPPATPEKKPSTWSKLWPIATAAVVGAGGYALADWMNKPDAPQQPPPSVADRFGGSVMTYEP